MRFLQRSISQLRKLKDLEDLHDLVQLRKSSSVQIQMETVAQWCEALATRIRAGDTLARAVAETPSSPGLALHLNPLRLRIQRGMDLVTACSSLIDDVVTTSGDTSRDTSRDASRDAGPNYWRETVGVIRVCAVGAPEAAKTLDKLARNLRVREAIAQEARAQTASARLSAGLLTALPAGAVIATLVISPSSAQVFTTVIGVICVTSSLLLNVMGWIWIRSLLRSVER
jgi:hypothetical protein